MNTPSGVYCSFTLESGTHDGTLWVIEQFFDNLDHQELMSALRRRIGDGEMLGLIYRWLKAGYLLDGNYHDTDVFTYAPIDRDVPADRGHEFSGDCFELLVAGTLTALSFVSSSL